MSANIWRSEARDDGIRCRLNWGQRVEILAIHDAMVQVRDVECTGWVSVNLLDIE